MTQIKIKRVYERKEFSDGLRVLVDRIWPRGIKKERLQEDIWAKEIAPSVSLREWFHQNEKENWNEFCKRYRKELHQNPYIQEFIGRIRKEKIVTLLYASKNKSENHANVLQDFLKDTVRKSDG